MLNAVTPSPKPGTGTTIHKYVDGVRYNGNLIYLTYVVEEYNTRSTVQLYTIRRAWLDYCACQLIVSWLSVRCS